MAQNYFYPIGDEFVIGDMRFDVSSAKLLHSVMGGWIANHEAVEHSVQATWGGLVLADGFIRSKPPQAPNANRYAAPC